MSEIDAYLIRLAPNPDTTLTVPNPIVFSENVTFNGDLDIGSGSGISFEETLAFAKGITITGDDDTNSRGVDISGACTTAISVTGAFTTGVSIAADGTTGISITNAFTGVAMISLAGTASGDGILISGACADALHISGSNTTSGIHISGDQAIGILYDVDAAATDGLKILVDDGITLTTGINIDRSGTTGICTTAISIDTDGTTGIEIAAGFTGTTMLSLAGTATDGIKISGICADGIEISAAATTTGLNISADCVTGVTIAAQTTAGINITGDSADGLIISGAMSDNGIEISGACTGSAIEIVTGAFGIGLNVNADGTTGIAVSSNFSGTTMIELAGTAADGILISGACSDNGIEISGACTGSAIEVVTGGFGIGLNVNADGTTGIAVADTFSGTTMLSLAGTGTDGINISGICADAIEISAAATTTGLNISADCVTGITIGAQTTAGITIGATVTGISITGATGYALDIQTSGQLRMGIQGTGIPVATATPFAMEIHAEATTELTAGDTGLSCGIRCRYEISSAQGNQISLTAVEGRLRVKHDIADGCHSGVSGTIEGSETGTVFSGTATTQRNAGNFCVELSSDCSVTSGWLTGVTIDSSTDGSVSMASCTYVGLRIKTSSSKEIWEHGIYVDADSVATGITLGACTVTGVDIGACATGINFSGACTTAAISMDAATFADGDHEIQMRNNVSGDKTVICSGAATDDAGIVTAVGADADIADGSLYLSCTDGGGVLFIKKNDIWTAFTNP